MFTQAAARSMRVGDVDLGVFTRAELMRRGFTRDAIRAQLAARRWDSVGRAIIVRTGSLDRRQRWSVALINAGASAVLTAFSTAESFGLVGWERDEVHVLVPVGVRVRPVDSVRVVVHRARDRSAMSVHPSGWRQRLAPALLVAAATFTEPRPACGLLAAAVQQRLLRPEELQAALEAAPTMRHRRILVSAADDIAMGAQALSEIDFMRLCRAYRLPRPVHQAVRCGPGGRRRYLDAEWIRADGRRVVAEVDGALHLEPLNWIDDQLRQNEVSLSDSIVLRFPAVVVRTAPASVAQQLRQALQLHEM